jgi:hypothetical protein
MLFLRLKLFIFYPFLTFDQVVKNVTLGTSWLNQSKDPCQFNKAFSKIDQIYSQNQMRNKFDSLKSHGLL